MATDRKCKYDEKRCACYVHDRFLCVCVLMYIGGLKPVGWSVWSLHYLHTHPQSWTTTTCSRSGIIELRTAAATTATVQQAFVYDRILFMQCHVCCISECPALLTIWHTLLCYEEMQLELKQTAPKAGALLWIWFTTTLIPPPPPPSSSLSDSPWLQFGKNLLSWSCLSVAFSV